METLSTLRDRASDILLAVLMWIALSLLGGCAYRDINPQAAAADERALDDSLRVVTPGAAKLVLRSSGAGHAVVYSVSKASEPCQGFETVGNVAYSGRGVVFPWIARMNERTRSALFKTQPYIEHELDPRQGVRLKAVGNWQQANAPRTLPISTGSCGPLVTRFRPAAGHVYLVDFVWRDNLSCTQVITDATDPSTPQPVQFDLVQSCPTP
jgi:hypothetical protein